jgi:hypothetical protein
MTVPVTFFGRVSVKVTELPGREGLIEEVSTEVGLALTTI